ncbi:MAG: SH3 domain-containing protein [Oscillospiraceae bacterium]|nr:SH3 domain-containing protein [Oscillospiraceae bacterium]
MKKIKQFIGAVLIVAALASVLAVSASAAGTVAYGAATVKASALNIRSGQGTDTSVVGLIPNGEVVVILDKTSADWYHINYHGTEGYVSTAYLVDVLTAENFNATGTVTATDVRCRVRPGTSYDIVGMLKDNGKYEVVGINSGWYKIKYDSSTYAYVRSDLMSITGGSGGGSASSSSSSSTESYSGTGVVTGTDVRCRAGASTSTEILGYFTYGASYEVTGKDGNWYKVKFSGSTEGYIYGDYLRLSDGSSSSTTTSTSSSSGSSAGQAIADFALQFVGYNYVYGGASPSEGFDCSGLVYYTYRSLGYTDIQRGAGSQYRCDGTWVAKSDLVPGDLVFFSSDDSGVTHVGIYIGDGNFVHASTSRTGVIISSLYSDYYMSVYYGAKRIAW